MSEQAVLAEIEARHCRTTKPTMEPDPERPGQARQTAYCQWCAVHRPDEDPRWPCETSRLAALVRTPETLAVERLEANRVADDGGQDNLGPSGEAGERALGEACLDLAGDGVQPVRGLVVAHGGDVDDNLDVGSKPGERVSGHGDKIQPAVSNVNRAVPWRSGEMVFGTDDACPYEGCPYEGCDREADHSGDHGFRPFIPGSFAATPSPTPPEGLLRELRHWVGQNAVRQGNLPAGATVVDAEALDAYLAASPAPDPGAGE